MTNNAPLKGVNDKDVLIVVRAQNRVQALYNRLRKKGGWRAVMNRLRLLNVAYAYDFVTKGKVPKNPETRVKLYLPRVLPSEKRARIVRIKPLMGNEGWQDAFFKAPRKFKSRRNPKMISGR